MWKSLMGILLEDVSHTWLVQDEDHCTVCLLATPNHLLLRVWLRPMVVFSLNRLQHLVGLQVSQPVCHENVVNLGRQLYRFLVHGHAEDHCVHAIRSGKRAPDVGLDSRDTVKVSEFEL